MHVDGCHRQNPFDFQWRHLQNGRLVAILDFFCFQTQTLLWLWISTSNFSSTILMYMVGTYWFSAISFSKWPPGGHIIFDFSVSELCRWHDFRSESQVCLGISISNFKNMWTVAIGRSLVIFNDVTFKKAPWRPFWIFWFPDSNFTLALNINFKLQQHNTYIWG